MPIRLATTWLAVTTPLCAAPQNPCPTATVLELGTPCGNASLTSEIPILGTTATMTVDGDTPGFLGVLFQDSGPATATSLSGCDVFLNQLNPAAVFTTDANGDADIDVAVPNDPMLCGARIVTQAAIATGLGSVFGFEVSNATELRVGTAPGTFPADWIHGSANCALNPDPPIQVHAYDSRTWILRQNACLNFEAPFMYLLAGDTKAILIDTGATSSASQFPIRATVQSLLDAYEASHSLPDLELVVAHSHGHGDHLQGDGQFMGQPDTTVVGTGLGSVQAFFGITSWPTQIASFDLGGRTLDIIPTPGHHSTHVCFYDRETGVMLTGDTFYPGYLFISNLSQYKQSTSRLVQFAATHPITYLLGGHIEMQATPGVWYPYGTVYQPNERVLQLQLVHLLELDTALQSIFGPTFEIHDDFIIRVF